MTESPEGPAPDGAQEAVSVASGEPTRPDPSAGAEATDEQPRPDLDQRQRRLSTTRKPMGPPLRESTVHEESRPRERTEGPTEPS